jgi:hypothetical protein
MTPTAIFESERELLSQGTPRVFAPDIGHILGINSQQSESKNENNNDQNNKYFTHHSLPMNGVFISSLFFFIVEDKKLI